MTPAGRPVSWPPPPAGGVVWHDQPAVVLGADEPIEHALKRFKRQVSRSGVLYALREWRRTPTRGERRRAKGRRAAKRRAKLGTG